jgi:hypothetical protein
VQATAANRAKRKKLRRITLGLKWLVELRATGVAIA